MTHVTRFLLLFSGSASHCPSPFLKEECWLVVLDSLHSFAWIDSWGQAVTTNMYRKPVPVRNGREAHLIQMLEPRRKSLVTGRTSGTR